MQRVGDINILCDLSKQDIIRILSLISRKSFKVKFSKKKANRLTKKVLCDHLRTMVVLAGYGGDMLKYMN